MLLLAMIAYAVFGAAVAMVLTFFATYALSFLEKDVTGRGAWMASLFFTLPIAGIVGVVVALIWFWIQFYR